MKMDSRTSHPTVIVRPPRPMAGAPYSFRLRRAVCNTFPRPRQLRQDDSCVTFTCIPLGGMSKFFLTFTESNISIQVFDAAIASDHIQGRTHHMPGIQRVFIFRYPLASLCPQFTFAILTQLIPALSPSIQFQLFPNSVSAFRVPSRFSLCQFLRLPAYKTA